MALRFPAPPICLVLCKHLVVFFNSVQKTQQKVLGSVANGNSGGEISSLDCFGIGLVIVLQLHRIYSTTSTKRKKRPAILHE